MEKKARIVITMDEFGNLETWSNVAIIEQQRDLLILALKTLGSPKVYGGAHFGPQKPDLRRQIPRIGESGLRFE